MLESARRTRRLLVWHCVIWVLSACHSSRSNGPSADANTNWLSYCDVNTDCRNAGACICGLCTVTCQSDAECARGERAASCVSPLAANSEQACAAIVQNSKQQICLADCDTGTDCAKGSTCTAGACWPRPDSVVDLRDAGQDASTSSVRPVIGRPPSIDASMDIGSYDAAVSFETPGQLTEPMTHIKVTGDAPSLLGTWVQKLPRLKPSGGLMRLDIHASNSDGITGTLTFECPAHAENCDASPPLQPPTDPNLGYPLDLSPRDQDALRENLRSNFPYRVFDGRITAQGFRFWFSNNDVWREWCKLQTSYLVHVGDGATYTCLADAATTEQLYTDPNRATGKQWLCVADNSVCGCSAEACTVNPYGAARDVDLVRQGDTLQGTFSIGETFFVTLERAASESP